MLTQWRAWRQRRPRLTVLAALYATAIGILGPMAVVGTGGGRLDWVYEAIIPMGWAVLVVTWLIVGMPLLLVSRGLPDQPAFIEWLFGFLVWGAAGVGQAAFLIVVWDGVRLGFRRGRAHCNIRRLNNV